MENYSAKWDKVFTKPPQSYWMASTKKPDYSVLDKDIKADAAIVGGGISGITTAFLLKSEGLKVAIIEADRILQGTTGHTTAKVTSQHSLIYHKLINQMGEEKAKQYAQSNEWAIDFIDNISKEHNIDCDFERCPAYVYTANDMYVKNIENEAKAAQKLGIKADYLEEIPVPGIVKAAVRFDNQARFHPLKYLIALAEKIQGDGSYIFEHTRAVDLEKGNLCSVITEKGHKVIASHVFIASHFPFYDGMGFYFTRLYPDRSYVIAVKIKEKYPGGMYITAEDPGRSLRSQSSGEEELVLVGGEHHKTGQDGDTLKHYENLKSYAEQTFQVLDIPYRWSTQDYSTADGVPYAGYLTSNTPNIYVSTGFGKWGMTNSTVSAAIIKDLIIKGESPWEPVYNPSRFTPAASAKKFIIENVNVAKELVTGKLASIPDDVKIEKGEGKSIEIEGKKVGAYRDQEGTLHVVDTTCTHMGCELQWNSAEKTWDCPCHGSRFTYEGDIVEGPALKNIRIRTR
jgi:glycine/D-amino acid oxidase-like deaminating enzyme/nitrite reductase/ring-hydroxylating ferredoxin subunit